MHWPAKKYTSDEDENRLPHGRNSVSDQYRHVTKIRAAPQQQIRVGRDVGEGGGGHPAFCDNVPRSLAISSKRLVYRPASGNTRGSSAMATSARKPAAVKHARGRPSPSSTTRRRPRLIMDRMAA